jgi:hypothetical protein
MTTEHSVWTKYVSARQARTVGKALRDAGYSITNEQVREMGYALNIGNYLEPGDVKAREQVYDVICEAAGFQPRAIPLDGTDYHIFGEE